MTIKQLSVFLENKPGQLLAPCRILADAGLNIITLSLADTRQFGILRLIVREWEKARALLEAAGCVVKVTDVLALEVEDRPGGLADIVAALDKAGVNIEYMYAFAFGARGRALLVLRFADNAAALAALAAGAIPVVRESDLSDWPATCGAE